MSDSNDYKILNLNVYKGLNSANLSVDERSKVLPTIQKAVLNVMRKLEFYISDRINGCCYFLMDNYYACLDIAMILRDQCNMYSTVTVRINRKIYPRKVKCKRRL